MRGPVNGVSDVVRFPAVAFAEVGKVLRTPGGLADGVFVVAGNLFPTNNQRGRARGKWVSTMGGCEPCGILFGGKRWQVDQQEY